MILLAVMFGALTLAVLAVVMLPLLRGRRVLAERAAYDRAVYRDQLKELDRDVARGLIAEREAAAARLEIQRRILAADAAPASARPVRQGSSPRLALTLCVLVAAGAAGLYGRLGDPTVPDEPFAARVTRGPGIAAAGGLDPGHIDMLQAAEALAAKLKTDPGNAEGWLLYARTLARLGQWERAATAYQQVLTLRPGDAEVNAAYGEMLVMAVDGIVSPAAHAAFTAAVAANPQEQVARFYLALADLQAGQPQKAIDAWLVLAREVPSDSPMRAEANRHITEAAASAGLPVPALPPVTAPVEAPAAAGAAAGAASGAAADGPDAAAIAAAGEMSPEQRSAMIRSMVEKLAAQLQAQPNDADGWVRLGRAYMVQAEPAKAAAAYDRAAALRPDDVSIPLQEVAALLEDRPANEPVPARATTLLARLQARNPDRPDVLWYLGEAAAQNQKTDEAEKYWAKLLTVLPPNSENAKNVQEAIKTLKKG